MFYYYFVYSLSIREYIFLFVKIVIYSCNFFLIVSIRENPFQQLLGNNAQDRMRHQPIFCIRLTNIISYAPSLTLLNYSTVAILFDY
jgi:hypothetical protein